MLLFLIIVETYVVNEQKVSFSSVDIRNIHVNIKSKIEGFNIDYEAYADFNVCFLLQSFVWSVN